LGVLFWELTTGRSPFQNASALQIVQNILYFDHREDPNPATPIEYVSLYKKCWDLCPEKRPEINEVDNTVSNIKLEADKKFDENILNTEQCASNFSVFNTIIANLFQDFIKLYIKDMDTNSDDTVNDINSWLKNNQKNSKKILDFAMSFEIERRETIIAYFFMKGFGTDEDYEECLHWCKKGCEKKDIYSYYEAAFCYRYCLENYNEAFHYFNLAASGGILKAKRELAIMYMNGMGCKENKAKAFDLFKESGDQDKIACCMVSDCYYEGIGIETNLNEALKCYKICWKKWRYPNAKIRIPLIEKKL
ncbi:19216_t:CDS:1, partial [Racocetra persica]